MNEIKYDSPKAFHTQLRDILLSQMARSGKLTPGDRLPSIRDIAGKYQLSNGTVLRSLKSLQELGLLELRQGRRFFVTRNKYLVESAAKVISPVENSNKRHLPRSRRKYRLSLLLTSKLTSFYAELSERVLEVLRDNGHIGRIFQVDYSDQKEIIETVGIALEDEIDAMIIGPYMPKDTITVSHNMLTDKKVGALFFALPGPRDVNYVTTDISIGEYQAMKYLARLGHHNVGYATGVSTKGISEPWTHYPGYERAIRERLINDNPLLIYEPTLRRVRDGMRKYGYDSIDYFLSLETRPTAIYYGDDISAMGAITALTRLGLEVANDISVIGCNNIFEAELNNLTTVGQPFEDLAREIVRGVIHTVKAPNDSYRKILPTKLIVRKSASKVKDMESVTLRQGDEAEIC